MDVIKRRSNVWKNFKPIISILYLISLCIPQKIITHFLARQRFKVGWKNIAFRYILLKRLGTTFKGNDYCIIHSNVNINSPDKLIVGERVTINDNSTIECSGGVEIGSDVMIAHEVSILSNSHNFTDVYTSMNKQGMSYGKVKINNNVWIGAKVTILKGITIGEGAIIGANSLVNKDVPPFQIVGGVPAKFIRERESI